MAGLQRATAWCTTTALTARLRSDPAQQKHSAPCNAGCLPAGVMTGQGQTCCMAQLQRAHDAHVSRPTCQSDCANEGAKERGGEVHRVCQGCRVSHVAGHRGGHSCQACTTCQQCAALAKAGWVRQGCRQQRQHNCSTSIRDPCSIAALACQSTVHSKAPIKLSVQAPQPAPSTPGECDTCCCLPRQVHCRHALLPAGC